MDFAAKDEAADAQESADAAASKEAANGWPELAAQPKEGEASHA